MFSTASIGLAPGRAEYTNPDDIMRDADTAMYHAKARGKARHELFDADMHARTRDRLGLENDLRHAVINRDFDVQYQPSSEIPAEADRTVGEEDLDTAFYRDGVIDLRELVREQLYLQLPMKPLCQPECRGLCPSCGANRNVVACTCAQRPPDPRLAALRDLAALPTN